MKKLTYGLSLLMLLLYTWYTKKVHANSQCLISSKFHIIKDWRSNDNFQNQRPCDIYKKTGDASYISCYKQCWELQPCFYFSNDNINCYMCIDQNEVLVSDDLQSTSYTLSQGDRVYEKMDIDDCWSSPCVNGGTCSDGVYAHLCQCPILYGGDFCQIGCYQNNTYELYYDTDNEAWPFSNWDTDVFCPNGSYAAGFQILFETGMGTILDDSALNKLRFFCKYPDNTVASTIEAGQTTWGLPWNTEYHCPDNYFITAFQQLSDPLTPNINIGIEMDDVGITNFKFNCTGPGLHGTDVQTLTDPDAGVDFYNDWDEFWREWTGCVSGEAVCGMAARYVPPQGTLIPQDDGAMINIKMHCCGCDEE